MLSLEMLVQEIDSVPPLPTTVTRALQVIEDRESSAKELAKVLAEDQSITATLLKYANSAYYGVSRTVSTVSEATVILGFTTIRSMLLTASVHKLVNREISGYALAQGELWKHSIQCAMVAKNLAKKCKFPQVEQAFVAGLIHDIGKVVLNNYVGAQYREIISTVEQEHIPFMEAEKQILGFNHAEVGARLALKWNLPEDLVDAIAHHHSPRGSERNSKLTALVHVADAICLMLGFGLGSDGLLYPLDEAVLDMVGLTVELIEEAMVEVQELPEFDI
ncbi:MAG: HDOD domain-containing protein [Clostridia bacterium]|nr:HDOD domain-containing protein [Clostridia bacterium]